MANYVNNKQFLQALIEHKEKVKQAEKQGKQKPQISNYIGECLLQISNRLSSKPQFSGYKFRDEMVSDGIENCILYLDNFDPEKSQNPFAYFTQIIYHSFLRRLEKEHKHLYIKYKVTEHVEIFNLANDHQNNDNLFNDSNLEQSEHSKDYRDNFVRAFEKKRQNKKGKVNK